MTYPPIPKTSWSEASRSFPRLRRALPLWPSPIAAGLYGDCTGGVLWVTTDHRTSLARLGASVTDDSTPAGVLCLQGGGLLPDLAAGLGLVRATQAADLLAGVPLTGGELRTPLLLAQSLGWVQPLPEAGETAWPVQPAAERETHSAPATWRDETATSSAAQPRLFSGPGLPAGWRVVLVPAEAKLGSVPTPLVGDQALLWARLRAAGLLWAGQALFFALPLVIFGLPALGFGLAALLLAALLLALLWPWLPGPGWSRGALVGLVLAAGVTLLSFLVLNFPLLPAVEAALAAWLAGVWMGIVLCGARP